MKQITCIIISLISFTVNAHETRSVAEDSYQFIIDFASEPAFEDVVNALDWRINSMTGNPVDTDTGDIVDLSITLWLVAQDKYDARVLHSFALPDPVRKKFGTANRYQPPFKPSHDGAYGFLIQGEINGVTIDEKFVCGQGTLSDHGFGCVQDPVVFPGNLVGSIQRDRAGYHDSDLFSIKK